MQFNTRLMLCAVVPAGLFVAALAASLWGLVRTQHEFDRYVDTQQAISTGFSEMYAQGLQMGQALRNIVLDPANKKAFENFSAAESAYAQAYGVTSQAARGSSFEAGLQELIPLREAQAVQQKRILALATSDTTAAAQALNSDETPAWRQLRSKLLAQIDAGRKVAAATYEGTQRSARQMTLLAVSLALLALAVSGGLFWLMRRTVAVELGGDPAAAGQALRRMADGDLTRDAAGGSAKGLMGELQRTQLRLLELVGQVQISTDGINTASAEIASGNLDLSTRTEQAASSIQQTASAMEQLTATVKQSADSARQANQLSASAAEVAQRGGAAVREVVHTMDEINASSKKIADIVGVIDGIAFQTNILALNAAVEAARAGEEGRGFAVVASEVRNLAQRSAEAAKAIKGLIGASVDRVETGSRLVASAGATMTDIVASVQRVTVIIGEISTAAAEQSDGIGQVNLAVSQLDRMTQQNAALVEESAAAAESLKDQAHRLAQVVSVFRLRAPA
jgi:methyl-accepting chemotaxis protein